DPVADQVYAHPRDVGAAGRPQYHASHRFAGGRYEVGHPVHRSDGHAPAVRKPGHFVGDVGGRRKRNVGANRGRGGRAENGNGGNGGRRRGRRVAAAATTAGNGRFPATQGQQQGANFVHSFHDHCGL
ncbi:MAG: hypothetical protein AVDCRST_MAG56-6693, partial [uncultured Cytophagales bacterium]